MQPKFQQKIFLNSVYDGILGKKPSHTTEANNKADYFGLDH
jgi:hypothetical protein